MRQTNFNIDSIDFSNMSLKEYIYILCKNKGITAKDMCDDIGISYTSFKAQISKSISAKRLKLIVNYLGGNFATAFDLPLTK